jgi:hypothetical protein
MQPRINHLLKAAVIALPAGLLWLATATGQSTTPPSPVPHAATLSDARVDLLADGRYTVTMDVTGDLAGSVTLMLVPKGDGSFGGEWAFTVAHVDNTDPATGIEPEADPHHEEGAEPDGDAPHRDFVRLVRRGAFNGTIANATLDIVADALTGLSATIVIDQGAGEFAGALGSGEATLTSLNLNY